MEITRVSILTGQFNTMEINVTQEQIDAWKTGTLIQNAMPNISEEEREFLISGITPTEWDEIMNGCSDETSMEDH